MSIDRTDGRSLRSSFLESSSRYPERPALVVGARSFAYRELEELARRFASAILSRLGRRPERVGILASRSEVSYAGSLGAMFSGAAFVPLNPSFPLKRTEAMLEQADVDCILVDERAWEAHRELVGPRMSEHCVLIPNGRDREELDRSAPLDDLPPLVPEDLAYLLFTSGSTGRPKGVPIDHGAITHFLGAMSRRYAITPEDRFTQTFEPTFDLSMFDLFLPWSHGASVYAMTGKDLLAPASFVNRNQLTIWFSVPSLAALMLRKGTLSSTPLPSLRLSLFCGEALPLRVAEAWQAAAPSSVVENLYGPTEATVACFAHRWDPASSVAESAQGNVPIGRPFEGLAAVVAEGDRILPDEAPGELLVSGPQLSPGYWRDREQTERAFVWLESGGRPRRFYRTGDRVVRRPSGHYVFLGRTDHQVKVHGGHRVELGDVEAGLRSIEAVRDVAVVAVRDEEGVAKLAAFVISDEAPEAITRAAQQILPLHMLPRVIVPIDAFPLNANGKVDRKVLAERLRAEEP